MCSLKVRVVYLYHSDEGDRVVNPVLRVVFLMNVVNLHSNSMTFPFIFLYSTQVTYITYRFLHSAIIKAIPVKSPVFPLETPVFKVPEFRVEIAIIGFLMFSCSHVHQLELAELGTNMTESLL